MPAKGTIIIAALAVLTLARAASADIIIAQTDFGTTEGTDITPFVTDYSPGAQGRSVRPVIRLVGAEPSSVCDRSRADAWNRPSL